MLLGMATLKEIHERRLERLRLILSLREAGWTFEAIGERFGASRNRAWQLYGHALRLQGRGHL